MSEHTKGPWRVVFRDYGDEVWFGGEGEGMMTIWANDSPLAYLGLWRKEWEACPVEEEPSPAEREANARLIARAPELDALNAKLLEALEGFVSAYDLQGVTDEEYPELGRARAALAEARHEPS